MTNAITDQLSMVQTINISCLPFMTQSLKPEVGNSIIVFRDEIPVNYIKSARLAPNIRIKARRGDIVIVVTHRPRYYRIAGKITTRDKCIYRYEIPVTLIVRDPYRIACSYLQEKDPVQQVISNMQKLIGQYALLTFSDKLNPNNLPLLQWSNTELVTLGLTVTQNNKASLYVDPQYNGPDLEILRLHRATELQIERLSADHKIKIHESELKNRRDAAQNDFKRQEETRNQLYNICKEIREKAAIETVNALQARIYEGFAGGESPSQISNTYFTLLGIFQDKKHANIEKTIIDTGLSYSHEEDETTTKQLYQETEEWLAQPENQIHHHTLSFQDKQIAPYLDE